MCCVCVCVLLCCVCVVGVGVGAYTCMHICVCLYWGLFLVCFNLSTKCTLIFECFYGSSEKGFSETLPLLFKLDAGQTGRLTGGHSKKRQLTGDSTHLPRVQ